MRHRIFKTVSSRMGRRLVRKTKHSTRVKTRGKEAKARRPHRWGARGSSVRRGLI